MPNLIAIGIYHLDHKPTRIIWAGIETSWNTFSGKYIKMAIKDGNPHLCATYINGYNQEITNTPKISRVRLAAYLKEFLQLFKKDITKLWKKKSP